MSNPNTKPCPKCEGGGLSSQWNGSFKITKLCPNCNGSGRIRNEKLKKLK